MVGRGGWGSFFFFVRWMLDVPLDRQSGLKSLLCHSALSVLWGSVCALCRDERTSFPHAPTEAPSKSESWPALGEASQEVGAAKRETSSGGVPADFDGYLD